MSALNAFHQFAPLGTVTDNLAHLGFFWSEGEISLGVTIPRINIPNKPLILSLIHYLVHNHAKTTHILLINQQT